MASHGLLSSATRAARRARHLPALLERLPLIREKGQFISHEIGHAQVALPYTLRKSGLVIYLRHHTTDVGALNEVFLYQLYRLPDDVRMRLDSLGRPPRVLDLGAHVGMFGVWFLGLYPDATITALEPDPLNATMLRRTVRANHHLDDWRVVEAAVSNTAGRARFRAGLGAASRMAVETDDESLEVEVIDVFDLFADADLVKMDIEGAEWSILLDARLNSAPIEALVLEYHPAACPTSDPRRCAEDALRNAGFTLREIADQGRGMGMLWACRKRP